MKPFNPTSKKSRRFPAVPAKVAARADDHEIVSIVPGEAELTEAMLEFKLTEFFASKEQ